MAQIHQIRPTNEHHTKQWMEYQPLITITARVRGAIHEHSVDQLNNQKYQNPTSKPS